MILEFLQLLARAVRHFRTYPPTSRLCTDAIDACHAAFSRLALDEPLQLRVTSSQLLVGDDAIAADNAVEHELREPLHVARIASIEFDRHVSARDWLQFCTVLAASIRASKDTATVAERLLDAGVGSITVRMTPRPEVFDLGAPPPPVQHIVGMERARQAAAEPAGPAQYLYPPDKGWVRLDPTCEDAAVSLVDLAVLVNDPGQLASMLARLVDDTGETDGGDRAPLRDRYDDVVMLIGALEPRLGRVLLSKLARAVLDLDLDRRRALLRRSILPRLLDGRIDGQAVLAEFPDVDLADALSLLLDLEAASPQMVPLALDHLQLAPERRTRMIPLVQATLDGRAAPSADRWAAAGFDQHAQKLIRIDADAAKDFSEFAAFDLAIDEPTAAALGDARDAIAESDATEAWLGSIVGLARIEPNPSVVASLLARAVPVLQTLVRDDRWREATRWLARIGDVATALDATRPDVAAAIREGIGRFCDRAMLLQLARVSGTDAGRIYATMIVTAVGPSIVPAWIEALTSPTDRTHAMRLRPVLSECAGKVAPAIARRLPELPSELAAAAIAVLACGGGGFEAAIAAHVTDADDRTSREALRALARVATPKAAALIAWHLEHGAAVVEPAAEEALWRLPVPLALAKTHELLGRREFVAKHPQAATRLLERAVHSGDTMLAPLLETLAPLRFCFWSPALARVGAKARELL